MKYLVNAFSLNMFGVKNAPQESSELRRFLLDVSTVLEDDVRGMLKRGELTSAVGHESTAQILSERLRVPVAFNRQDIIFPSPHVDGLVVAQLPRPREGQIYTAEEIRNYTIVFFEIEEFSL